LTCQYSRCLSPCDGSSLDEDQEPLPRPAQAAAEPPGVDSRVEPLHRASTCVPPRPRVNGRDNRPPSCPSRRSTPILPGDLAATLTKSGGNGRTHLRLPGRSDL